MVGRLPNDALWTAVRDHKEVYCCLLVIFWTTSPKEKQQYMKYRNVTDRVRSVVLDITDISYPTPYIPPTNQQHKPCRNGNGLQMPIILHPFPVFVSLLTSPLLKDKAVGQVRFSAFTSGTTVCLLVGVCSMYRPVYPAHWLATTFTPGGTNSRCDASSIVRDSCRRIDITSNCSNLPHPCRAISTLVMTLGVAAIGSLMNGTIG
ncbi:hypothetical protein CBL_13059 [Carabus blaptoides fortunei]